MLGVLMLWYGFVPGWQVTALPFLLLLVFGLSVCLEFARASYVMNPLLVGVIDGFRWSLLGRQVPLDWQLVAISAIIVAALLYLSVWYFRRMECGFADVRRGPLFSGPPTHPP